MKRHLHILLIIPFFLLCGCTKEREAVEVFSDLPIEFTAENPSTRAFTATTSAAGFKCTAVRTSGAALFSNLATGVDAGRSTTGYYWPMGESLSFYGVHPASQTMAVSSSGAFITVGSSSQPFSGSQDIIAMKKADVAFGTSPVPVTFDHILAGIDDVYLETEEDDDYEIFITSATITVPCAGRYNLLTDSWIASSTVQIADLGSYYETGGETIDTGFSRTIIPGTCTIDVDYEIYGTEILVFSRSAEVTLSQGKRSTINVKVPHGRGALEVTVSVKDWEEEHEINETI